ncbi:phosphopantetheine-binding protein [Asaia astilbis]|uniref:phosphopantetheine-binding protein n=1 Tax=Asaia astilbis TaxID=610244 RepID=UPI000470377F|nr:phosphopantetheine-binding protein [Asaia astilbis]
MSSLYTSLSTEEAKLATLIVTTLNLEIDSTDVTPETPLYGEGLGLDSIDMLEIALVVSQEYGVRLRADDENNGSIFENIRSLSAYIQGEQSTI